MAVGRKRKPTALHLVAGTKPSDSGKPRRNEPKPKRVNPAKPDWLSEKASTAWDRLLPLLGGMGVLTKVDGAALERMCEVYADIRECENAIAAHGYTYLSHTESGTTIKANPAVAAKRAFELLFKSYLSEFGLTPAARSRVEGDGSGEEEEEGDGLLD